MQERTNIWGKNGCKLPNGQECEACTLFDADGSLEHCSNLRLPKKLDLIAGGLALNTVDENQARLSILALVGEAKDKKMTGEITTYVHGKAEELRKSMKRHALDITH